ncbi:MAG: hypothetical protein QXG18_02750 [Candidatus Pacearchaeota archaeon]
MEKVKTLSDFVYRISYVKMFYVKEDVRKETPDPFAEFRTFVFLQAKLTEEELREWQERLRDEAENLTYIFDTISVAREKQVLLEEDAYKLEYVSATKKTRKIPKIKIEINGYEIQKATLTDFFKKLPEKLRYGKIYRFVWIKPRKDKVYEYDEMRISGEERKTFISFLTEFENELREKRKRLRGGEI